MRTVPDTVVLLLTCQFAGFVDKAHEAKLAQRESGPPGACGWRQHSTRDQFAGSFEVAHPNNKLNALSNPLWLLTSIAPMPLAVRRLQIEVETSA